MSKSEDSKKERRLSDLPILKHTDWLPYEDKNYNRMQHCRHPNNCCGLLEQRTQSGWESGLLHRDGAASLRSWNTIEPVSQGQKHIPGKWTDMCSASLPPNGGRKWRADVRALSSCMRWQRWRWNVLKRDVCPAKTSYLSFVGSGPEGDFRCRSIPWLYLLSKEITWRNMGRRWCRGPVRRNEDLSQDFMDGRAG